MLGWALGVFPGLDRVEAAVGRVVTSMIWVRQWLPRVGEWLADSHP